MQVDLAIGWVPGLDRDPRVLTDVARKAEEAGLAGIWVGDHLLQSPAVGPEHWPVSEAYTVLGFLAAATSRVRLGTLVSAVMFRPPALLVKQVTTLDLLSGGRAWLGIGAGYFEREHTGLGIPFPSLSQRQEHVEDAVRIALQTWGDDVGPYRGVHNRLDLTPRWPAPRSRPHPPILIGGNGARGTLSLVAKYADACNFYGPPNVVVKALTTLADRCAQAGRDLGEIERTAMVFLDLRDGPGGVDLALETLAAYRDAGVETVMAALLGVETLGPIETLGEHVLPIVAGWNANPVAEPPAESADQAPSRRRVVHDRRSDRRP